MCGRTACTLDKCGIQRATCQYSKSNTPLEWVEKYDWQNCKPSYNLAPSQISPVLTNASVFDSKEKLNNVITPMRWGLIPSWYKGTLEEFSIKTNNCRIEGILEKPTYRRAVSSNQRCVILADGFYEWKIINNKQKQPYFIYFPQEFNSDFFIRDYDGSENDVKYPRLLTMAGLFDLWKSSKNEVIYSYSVITMDSSKTVSFVHSRMPAILESKEDVFTWLDTDRVSTKDAISILKPTDNLQMHPVSNLVNFSRNNSVECLKPMVEKKQSPIKHTALTAWLKRETGESSAKRFKKE